MPIVHTAVVLLAAAVLAVPLAKRLGFGSPLGYLAAGLAIGPNGLALVTDAEAIGHVSELGVVMLLFLIGLELRPQRLWVMRRSVLGLGGAQLGATAALLGGGAALLGTPVAGSVVVGAGLALSSTAIALALLAERDLLSTRGGRDAFAILLFQDLAVIPLVALLPLLGGASAGPVDSAGAWIAVAEAAGAVLAVLVGGRLLVRPVFRLVDAAKTPEIFTATALLIVLGTASFVELAGLSMSLGAFMAGVLLSDSEYRHEVKADIEPFEGLLLGLFFVSVGVSADVAGFLAAPAGVLLLVLGLVAVKSAVVFALARLAGATARGAVRMGVVLAQGGEFGFVLFGLAAQDGVLSRADADRATMVVVLSMVVTPFLFAATERWLLPRLAKAPPRPFDRVEQDGAPPVIICGFGRVGQIVGRVLRVRGIPFTALEKSADQVDFVRRYGTPVFYGDPTRPELLRAAGADTARILVVALEDMTENLTVVDMAQRAFPHLTIAARAHNRRHAHLLMDRGVGIIERETFHSSLRLTERILVSHGMDANEARRTVETFRAHDERTLEAQHAVYRDERRLIQSTRDAAAELQSLFEADKPRR
ncbi:monovalent cation:proton antiporter-2 (CPA2) family protein [Azospirillum sp. ST 5-10]|uniref:monovalent cation:proton antiporter-2 (CPA2) family protein n=1 Tax=unclassified Azospirillum TaxID=2630922 RepID=UPI003F4A46B0